jgi:hypothetical protein
LCKTTTFVVINPFFQIDYSPILIITGKHLIYFRYAFGKPYPQGLITVIYDFKVAE